MIPPEIREILFKNPDIRKVTLVKDAINSFCENNGMEKVPLTDFYVIAKKNAGSERELWSVSKTDKHVVIKLREQHPTFSYLTLLFTINSYSREGQPGVPTWFMTNDVRMKYKFKIIVFCV